MTDRDIAILECIRFIKQKRFYRSVRTTYDMNTIDDSIKQLVEEIEIEFGVKESSIDPLRGE